MKSTAEEKAVLRRLEQLEMASKAREAEEFLERVEEVHATVKGLIDGTVDATELEKQHEREVLRKRAKELRKEEAAARARDELRMGRAGKGEGKRAYTYFCRFCLVEYELEDIRCCNRCGRELLTREQRVAELKERVQELKGERLQHASRKARWRRWLQTKKILRSSRLVVDYAAWERWEPSTDEDEKENEPPVTPADDPNFRALEQDLQVSARSRAGRRAAALRCKERGNALFRNGDWLGALQAYEEGLEQAREVKELWTNKCLVLLKMQEYEKAHEAATRLLEYCEIFEDGYTVSGDACFKAFARRALASRALRRFDEALADLRQATELQPNDKHVQHLLRHTEQQVEQLRHLVQLQRLPEGNQRDVNNAQGHGLRQRNKTPRPQEALQAIGEEGGRRLQQHQEALRETPAAAAAVGAAAREAAAPSATEGEAAVVLTAPQIVGAPETGAATSPAAVNGLASPKTAEAEGRQKTRESAADNVVAQYSTHEDDSDVVLEGRRRKSSATLAAADDTMFHVVGSNHPTSAATPPSPPPSPHEDNRGQAGGEKLFAVAPRPAASSSTTAEHAAGAKGDSVKSTGGLGTLPSTSVPRSPSTSFPPSLSSSAEAAFAAGDNSAPSGPSVQAMAHDVHPPVQKSNGIKGVYPSPSPPLVPAMPAVSPVEAGNAREALKQLQCVLYPAAVAGSFEAVDPPSLSAALQLLKFPPVKLSFCCSALPQLTIGSSYTSRPSDNENTDGTVSCSSETVQRKQGSRSETEETQEGGKARGLRAGEAKLDVHNTFLDICIADIRRGALRVRRQRREKAEARATTVQTNDQEAEEAAVEEAAAESDEAPGKKLSTPMHTAFDLYPRACFPALQLLHSVCFVEESSDDSRNSDEHNSSTEACNSCDKTDSKSSTAASYAKSQINSTDNCTASDATPPWLLEVCEAAAPYLLTLTSELLQLFVLDNRAAGSHAGQATEAEGEPECSSYYCGCHAGYKVVSHVDYQKSGGRCGACPQSTAHSNEDGKAFSADTSRCCAWNACANALAASMSLLQQLSVAPLTRRKVAEQLQRNSDGRAVLFGIPPLLLCCAYETTAAAAPRAARWPSCRQTAITDTAEDVSGSCKQSASPRSSSVLDSDQQKGTHQQAAPALAERRLQQARRDAGALLCNLLLEQPVLQLLLPLRRAGGKASDGQLLQGQLDNETQQHSNPVRPVQLEDHRKGAGADVRSVLRFLLSERLHALLRREQLLQQVEGAAAALSEQLDAGVRPLDLLSLLWKQAALRQQQQQQRGSRASSRERKQGDPCPLTLNVARSLSTPAATTYLEAMINTLLASTEELEELEAHAHIRATTADRTAEDCVLEEAQQALDIITNLGRSSAGRTFVLQHLQQELLRLLAVSGGATAQGRTPGRQSDRLSRALSGVENSQQHQVQQQQQLEAAKLLRELLTPPVSGRGRSGRFLQAADVLGLLLNLTASSGGSAGGSCLSSAAAQTQRQPVSSTSAAELTSLQQQLLLNEGRQLGMLPLLLPFIDRVTGQQQEGKKALSAGRGAAGQATAAKASSRAFEASPTFVAGLRSLTLVSRLVAAAGAAASTAAASTAAASKGEESRGQLRQGESQQKLRCLPPSQHSPPFVQAGVVSSTDFTQHRELVKCLLPRILRLLTPKQQLHGEIRPQQQQAPAQLQQALADDDRAAWGELHNASLLVLCALANLNVTFLLETAATTAAGPLGASTTCPAAQQQHKHEERDADKRQPQQTQEHTRDIQHSALHELAKVTCGWLQVLKPRGYAHQRAEMRNPVAMARGNFLLLVGHLARAQGAALQRQLVNEEQHQQHVKQRSEPAGQTQQDAGKAQCPQTQLTTATSIGTAEGERHAVAAKAAAATAGTPTGNAADETAPPPAEVLQRYLVELDLLLCVQCCVESLRKDVEGPQRNAAIALAALARITKYRPHIEALNGFESLMQIAAPQLLGQRR